MALLKTEGCSIAGITACVPKAVFNIRDFAFETDIERNDFIDKVGVQKKRIAPAGTTASDLCFNAANDIIAKLGWNKKEVDLLVFVTQTPDHNIPFGSSTLQHRLNLSNDCACFDFHTGCSGWVYGLSFIYGYMKAYGLKKALLLCGETSHIVSEQDKTTFPLIGDAGTATAIVATGSSEVSYFNLQTFGKDSDAIMIQDGGARNPTTIQSLQFEVLNPGVIRTRLQSSMNGQKILEFSLLSVPKNIQQLLQFATQKTAQVDYLLLHQANRILCEAIRKRIHFEEQKTPYSLQDFGNTSSASIPLTLVSQLQEQLSQKPNVILACGFGVGLSVASALLPLQKMNCVSLSEL